ncbi:TetR/AcrR family transcriptional regulator [Streptomyces sp. NPDC101455]|uniref:TetR/AcrR family transcriptional regulator n=1 Tax=Streptomyces sp. NPDC101455 TaxID=3366142 RepID=UPI003800AD48
MDTPGDGRAGRHDPRSRRTERALRQALVDLARENGLDAVTASALAHRAGIGRATFYRHYDSVPAFVESLRAKLIAELRDAFRALRLDTGMKAGTYEALNSRLNAVLLVAARDATLFRLLWEGGTGTDFRDRFRAEMAAVFADDLRWLGARIDGAYCPPEYMTTFTVYAITGVIGAWLAKARREPLEDVAFYLLALVTNGNDVLTVEQPAEPR